MVESLALADGFGTDRRSAVATAQEGDGKLLQ